MGDAAIRDTNAVGMGECGRASVTCSCGRARATPGDFVRWNSAVPRDRFYAGSPSTWQNVRLGRCLPPNEAHLDSVYPEWAIGPCWTLGDRCGLPKVSSPGPATSADLLELDAVPDPVDSDAPRSTFAEEVTQRNRRTERP